ncbi:hypothetical protein [Pseudomonas folii]|uniref:Uncharacterized protein n=1 Tax=Pseudomonas folii TaxID=2762593 RepID=A0ABR7B1W0_9PSED|nr:hypothetical protein [Pseudomonas folii]MBC3951127.1 hypothetical protein [Pseudomonas folii]
MSVLLSREDDQAWGQSVRAPLVQVGQGFQQMVARQAALSRTELCDQQVALLGPQGKLSMFSRQVAAQGRQAPLLAGLPESSDFERLQQAEKAVDFVLGLHHRRTLTDNPFHDFSRQLLCCMVFDDLSVYTLAERFAASEALRQRDSLYFINLIATTRHTVERRLVFMGLLEHFDALLPIEQCIYPVDYRLAQQRHLEREEALYGRLELEKSVSELLEEHTPEWLLTNLCLSRITVD